MSVRTTFLRSSAYGSGLSVLYYLTEREMGDFLTALGDGSLIAIAGDSGGIVGALEPKLADNFAKRDGSVIAGLIEDLKNAEKELKTLREIVREVMVEDEPGDHVWKIEDAIDDIDGYVGCALDKAKEV